MDDRARGTRWVRAAPLIVVLVAVLAIVVWKRDRLFGGAPTEAPPPETPADSGAAAPTASGGDEAAAVPTEAERAWREALGREPVWPADLVDPLDCAAVNGDLTALGRRLDGRDYLQRWNLQGGSRGLIVLAARSLAERPPVVSGEDRELDLVLSNAFHLFRVLGRDRLTALREIERREQGLAEPASLALFRWAVSRGKCGEDPDAVLGAPVLYDYGAYLLRSLGGQAYLRRRSPRVEGLATFYAVVALDHIIAGGHDPLFLDLRPDIVRARELVAGQELLFRDRYLEVLDDVAARWRAR